MATQTDGLEDQDGVLSPQELVALLDGKESPFLLVDCRSLMEFQTSHIKSAVNVSGTRLMRRRLQQNKITLTQVLTRRLHSSPSKDALLSSSTPVVLYDQCTDHISCLTTESFTYLVLQLLRPQYQVIKLLQGGFLSFQANCPSHCWQHTDKMADEDFVPGSIDDLDEEDFPIPQDSSSSFAKSNNSYVTQAGPQFEPLPPRVSRWEPLSGPVLSASNPGPTRILPHLWLGSQADSLSPSVMRLHSLTHVLNMSVDCPAPSKFLPLERFMRVPINDNYTDKLLPHLHNIFQFINEAKDAGGRVLVHCSAGISRSPSVAIAYLMQFYNMTMKEAYNQVKALRPTVSPNFNFLGQLVDLDAQLHSSRTHTIASSTPSTSLLGPTRSRDRPKCLPFAPYPSRNPKPALSPSSRPKHLLIAASPLLPSPSTHMACLQLASPGQPPLSLMSFPASSVTLNQLHFEPCHVAPSVPVPADPVISNAESVPSRHPIESSGDTSVAGSSSSLLESCGRSVVGMLRRSRSYEDMADQVRLVLPSSSSSHALTSPTHQLPTPLATTKCRHSNANLSNSSLSSGNSHSSSNNRQFSVA